MMRIRSVVSVHPPVQAQDGAGVKLKRFFPVQGFDYVDPFMLLDHFGSDNPDDYLAGFPMHPHRGIETVTYMLEGRIHHKDSTGRSGTIDAGGLQWMRAGSGIMHEEMPERTAGKLDGFQLWVNLAAKDKMSAASYQEYTADDITTFEHQGHQIRLISGTLFGHEGAVKHISQQPIYADISLEKGAISLPLVESYNAFIYVFEGELNVQETDASSTLVTAPNLATLSAGRKLILTTDTKARCLLIAGKPNNEPVARSGPFVMNTRAEIAQTWREIQQGEFPPQAIGAEN